MPKPADSFLYSVRDHFIIVLGLVGALGVISIPLQHYMPLGRFQHYGLAIFVLGLGYIIQSVWSWPHLRPWPRLGYTITAFYLASIGIVMYANPWLDAKVAVMTEEKENLKALIGWIYTILGLPLAYVYIEWMHEDYRLHKDSIKHKKKGSKN